MLGVDSQARAIKVPSSEHSRRSERKCTSLTDNQVGAA
jgi:hypothetical protein